jgi:hypothetical protein
MKTILVNNQTGEQVEIDKPVEFAQDYIDWYVHVNGWIDYKVISI